MAPSVDQPSAEEPGRTPAHKVRTRAEAKPRLEALETRCLMSGSHGSIDRFFVQSHELPAVAGAYDRIARHVRGHRHAIDKMAQVAKAKAGSSETDNDAGVERSAKRALAAFLGNPDPQLGKYVIVKESKTAHHTLATAQDLPDLPFFGVVATIGGDNTIDFYRLTLEENVSRLDFGLVFKNASSIDTLELEVFNGAGQLLGEWSSTSGSSSLILAQVGAQPAGSTFYLGIANSSGASASSAAVGYQLWVFRQAESQQPTAASVETSAPTPTASSAVSSGPHVPVAALVGTAPALGTAQLGTALQGVIVGGSTVAAAVGSPAILTGRPSVEALSRHESDQSAERALVVVVERDLGERNLTGPDIEQPDAAKAASRSGTKQDSDNLVAMDGPSGFALLGAVAIGHRRRTQAVLRLDLAAPEAPEQPAQPGPAGVTLPVAILAGNVEQALAEDDSRGAWVGLPRSLFSGLGLAVVLTLNAALSQPLAGFDFLATRFDSTRRKVLRGRLKAR
jgi:hypothetical protein